MDNSHSGLKSLQMNICSNFHCHWTTFGWDIAKKLRGCFLWNTVYICIHIACSQSVLSCCIVLRVCNCEDGWKTNPSLEVSLRDVTYVDSFHIAHLMLLALLHDQLCLSAVFRKTDSVWDHTAPAWSICSQVFPFFNNNPAFLLQVLFNVSLNRSYCPPCVQLPCWEFSHHTIILSAFCCRPFMWHVLSSAVVQW